MIKLDSFYIPSHMVDICRPFHLLYYINTLWLIDCDIGKEPYSHRTGGTRDTATRIDRELDREANSSGDIELREELLTATAEQS